jgi:putative glutamine amidotransferase
MIVKNRKKQKSKPVIVTNLDHIDNASNMLQIPYNYLLALEKAGAIPICLPPGINKRDFVLALKNCDGILLIGGRDYDPHLWGDERHKETLLISKTRQNFDISFARYALDLGYPVLGICGGHQLINILAGGTLFTSLETQFPGSLCHRPRNDPSGKAYHEVTVDKSCRLFSDLESTEFEVNSFHHQAVKNLGRGLRVVARAPDGVIEGIEGINSPMFGVQWHPEKEIDDPIQKKILKKFISICQK